MSNIHGLAGLATFVLLACLSGLSASAQDLGPGRRAASGKTTELRWTLASASAPWSARAGHVTAAFDNKLWVLGGATIHDVGIPDFAKDVWCSSDGSNWTEVTDSVPWGPHVLPAVEAFDGRLWMMGGLLDMHDVWSSPDGVNWTQATPNADWSRVLVGDAAVFDNKLWALGASTGNDAWYSLDGANWTQAIEHASWAARWSFASATFDGRLWVLGGSFGQIDVLNDVWYTSDGVNWSQATSNAPWHPRSQHAVVVYDNSLWLLGGYYYIWSGYGHDVHVVGVPLNDVWRSDDGINWTQVTSSAPWPAGGGQCAVLDQRLWLVHAAPAQDTGANQVWCMSPVPTVTVDTGRGSWYQVGDPLNLTAATSWFIAPPAYQWLKDGSPLPDQTNDVYHVDAIELSDAGSYTCQATESAKAAYTADPIVISVFPEGSLPVSGTTLAVLAGCACLIVGIYTLFQRRTARKPPSPC